MSHRLISLGYVETNNAKDKLEFALSKAYRDGYEDGMKLAIRKLHKTKNPKRFMGKSIEGRAAIASFNYKQRW